MLFAVAKLDQITKIYTRFLCQDIFYGNNSSTKAAGDGIYVVDAFCCQEVTNLGLNLLSCEDVWIEVDLNDKTNLFVGTVMDYILPTSATKSFIIFSRLLQQSS